MKISLTRLSVPLRFRPLVRIDLDAKNSIHIHETGKFKYQFRPVVFIEVLQDMNDRLLSVGGTIESIDTEKNRLCSDGACTTFLMQKTMMNISTLT